MRPTTSLSLSSDIVFDALATYPVAYVVYRWLERQVGRKVPHHSNAEIGEALGLSGDRVARAIQVLTYLRLVDVRYLTRNKLRRELTIDFRWSRPVVEVLGRLAKKQYRICLDPVSIVDDLDRVVPRPAMEPTPNGAVTKSDTCLEANSQLTCLVAETSVNEPVPDVVFEGGKSLESKPAGIRVSILESRVVPSLSETSTSLSESSTSNRAGYTIATLKGRYVSTDAGICVPLARPVGLVIDEEAALLAAQTDLPGGQETIVAIFEHWKAATGQKRSFLTENVRTKIVQRLKKFTPEQLIEVIDAVAADDWAMGRNTANKFYGSLLTNFRNDDKVMYWLAKPQRTGKADARALDHSVTKKGPSSWEQF